MNELNRLSVFGRRAGGPWIVVYDAKEVHDSNVSSHWEYRLHWTGQSWQERTGPDAYVYDYRKYADEDIAENGPTMVEKLPRNPDVG